MIEKVKRYIIVCDKCDCVLDEENEYPNETNFSTIEDAEEYFKENPYPNSLDESEWIRKGDKYYCGECYTKIKRKLGRDLI